MRNLIANLRYLMQYVKMSVLILSRLVINGILIFIVREYAISLSKIIGPFYIEPIISMHFC